MPKLNRRDFFSTMVDGLHGAALASILATELRASETAGPQIFDLKAKASHFPGKAKSVIHLFMNGGPSQVDLFDPKPELKKHAGSAPSRELAFAISNGKSAGVLHPAVFDFKPRGKCGMEISDALPHLAECADDITLIRSMYGEHANHEPALFLMHTGRTIASRPSIGSWVSYGLGTDNQNLPAYVVLDDPKGLPINGISNWQSAWLPPIYQGTRFRTEGPPVLNLEPRAEVPSQLVEAERNLLRKFDEAHRKERPFQPELDARISSYELSARMQLAASDALDITKETEATREDYGLNDPQTASYGKRCLMARRFDTHGDLSSGLKYACGKTDKPVAALLRDLKQRGLLDSTLVVWGGEFGRLPISQGTGKDPGRDHGPQGFSVWMAGAGVKRGYVHGATDEIGFKAAENRVSVHDFHATILHQLGLNYRDLAYERHGLKERLTDQFPARVVTEILA